eukprot:Tbor_TRINITY_DN6042_c1_g1::TRINITY_DN6042_c1_g1_i1::g.10636::m.10636
MRGGNSSGNFVADYVAKRTAQMEKARLLREERKRGSVSSTGPSDSIDGISQPYNYGRQPHTSNQQKDQEISLVLTEQDRQQTSTYNKLQLHNESNGASLSRPPFRPCSVGYSPTQVQSLNSHSKSTNKVHEVMITEEDLRGAVMRCIITPDQCRQLWGVLTDPSCDERMINKDFEGRYDSRNYNTKTDDEETVDRPTNTISQRNLSNPKKAGTSSSRYNPEEYQENNTDDEYREMPAVMETVNPSNSKVSKCSKTKKEWNFDTVLAYDDAAKDTPYDLQSARNVPSSTGCVTRKPGVVVKSKKLPSAECNGTSEGSCIPLKQPKYSSKNHIYEDSCSSDADTDEVAQFEAMKEKQRQQFEEALIQAEEVASSEPLLSCGKCGRKFRQGILTRHEGICAKINKKRKPIDMTKARIQEIEGASEVLRDMKRQKKNCGGASIKTQSMNVASKMPKWKMQHLQFQAVLKAVKQPIDNARGALQPPVMTPPELDYRVPCPHCGRKFASDTAERHIPKCANTINKPKSFARPPRR